MKVIVYRVNQDTGAETLDRMGELSDVIDIEDDEYAAVLDALRSAGRCWLGGGGAAPMFYVVVAP